MISTGKYKITIIVPCFNEVNTIDKIINKIEELKIEKYELIIVDDKSNDGSTERIKKISSEMKNIKTVFHEKNSGKGSAIKSGLKISEGDIILIQDADLEYDPNDYEKLFEPFLKLDADVVFGSRFIGGNRPRRLHFFWHSVANKFLTLLTNFFTNLNMTDMETGYKLFKKKYLSAEMLKERSFGIEPEITIKLAKQKIKFFEVPVSYNGRGYLEGKKITIKDGFVALYCILKYSIFSR